MTSWCPGSNPDLLLVDLEGQDGRMFFDRVRKHAGHFPIVISAPCRMKGASGGAFPDADAVYLPIECDLDETLRLIHSVLSTWHGEF